MKITKNNQKWMWAEAENDDERKNYTIFISESANYISLAIQNEPETRKAIILSIKPVNGPYGSKWISMKVTQTHTLCYRIQWHNHLDMSEIAVDRFGYESFVTAQIKTNWW